MSKRHKNVLEFVSGLTARKKRNGARAHQNMMYKLYQKNSSQSNARGAFMDIVEDLVETNSPLANKIYQTLYKSGALVNNAPTQGSGWLVGEKSNQLHKIINNGFPSGYEGGNNERNAHQQLLLYMSKRVDLFGTSDIDDLAKELYAEYEVFKGEGVPNLVFTKKELRENNLDRDDIKNSMRYIILEPRKRGWTSTFIPDAKQYGTQYGKGVDALKKMNKEMQKSEGWFGSDASMWAAVVPNSNGDGVQVVVMHGTRGSRDKSKMVGRMYEQGHDSKGNFITRPISYNNQEMFKKFQSWRRGHFMDAENDAWERTDTNLGFMQIDGLKTRMGKYYDKYSQKGFSPPRPRLPYINSYLNGVEIFDAGKFEWENVIKPFWEANKNLSEDEFADKWDKVMEEQTFTHRDQIYDYFNQDLGDPIEVEPMYGRANPAQADINKALKRTETQILKEEEKYESATL